MNNGGERILLMMAPLGPVKGRGLGRGHLRARLKESLATKGHKFLTGNQAPLLFSSEAFGKLLANEAPAMEIPAELVHPNFINDPGPNGSRAIVREADALNWEPPEASRTDPSICKISHDHMGRPLLLLNTKPGPSISFSYYSDGLWMAMGPMAAGLGVDVAGEEEFGTDYPFQRVYTRDELDVVRCCLRPLSNTLATALIWSVKEALVKAMGRGFHTVDFLGVRITSLENKGPYFRGAAGILPGKDPENKLPGKLTFVCSGHGDVWISVCLNASGRP